MPNKHQMQKDFDTKMKEWKEKIKVDTIQTNCLQEKHQKLILREACYTGIKGARKLTEEELAYMKSPEYKALVEEANRKIEEGRRREAKAWRDAKNYIGRERE